MNSGPNDTIILRINEVPRDWIAIFVGNVMTIAAETSKNAHNRPEMCGPVSKKERKLVWTEMNKNHIGRY